MKKNITILGMIVVGMIAVSQHEAYADSKNDLKTIQANYKKSIQKTNDMIKSQKNLQVQRTQTKEFTRGIDLDRAVYKTIKKTQDSRERLEGKSRDQLRQERSQSLRRADANAQWDKRMANVQQSQRMYADKVTDNQIQARQNKEKQRELKRLNADRMRSMRDQMRYNNQRIADYKRRR